MLSGEVYRELGDAAWTWVMSQLREDDGPWLPESVDEAGPSEPGEDRDSVYLGIGGLAPVLSEIALHRALTVDERSLSSGIVARLSATATTRIEASLYDGLAGDVTALRMLQPGSEETAMRRLAELMTPAGWNTAFEIEPGRRTPLTDLVMGTAGVVLAAIWAGGVYTEDIATTGGEALLTAADRTDAGMDWGMVPGWPSRGPNFSHGTAGISATLAVAGVALGRSDFVDAAREGARHLLSVGSLAHDGFIVPHTIPTSRRVVEPVTYSWCHGPTGTSQLFPALALAGVDQVDGRGVDELRRRCLHSVLISGIPKRLRPGFWDNDGRCCGTAGVGEVLLDAHQDSTDPIQAEALLAAAITMGNALVERAIRDQAGARWRFLEHRVDPPLLPPGTSWMQGAAGIGAFLFRLARVLEQGAQARVVDRPDQWWAVPAQVRTSHLPTPL